MEHSRHAKGDPLELLRTQHNEVRACFDRYLDAGDGAAGREAAASALSLLAMHSALEEAAFYPFVREADAGLVERCEAEHEEADRLTAQLQGMDAEDPLYDPTFRQLRQAVMHHLETEERRLFPEIRQSNIDIEQLGLEMQAFQSTMMGLRSQTGEARGARA